MASLLETTSSSSDGKVIQLRIPTKFGRKAVKHYVTCPESSFVNNGPNKAESSFIKPSYLIQSRALPGVLAIQNE